MDHGVEMAAANNGVMPSTVTSLTCAPRFSNKLHTLYAPVHAAKYKGERPSLLWTSTSCSGLSLASSSAHTCATSLRSAAWTIDKSIMVDIFHKQRTEWMAALFVVDLHFTLRLAVLACALASPSMSSPVCNECGDCLSTTFGRSASAISQLRKKLDEQVIRLSGNDCMGWFEMVKYLFKSSILNVVRECDRWVCHVHQASNHRKDKALRLW